MSKLSQKNSFQVQQERNYRHFKQRGFTTYGINKKFKMTSRGFLRRTTYDLKELLRPFRKINPCLDIKIPPVDVCDVAEIRGA